VVEGSSLAPLMAPLNRRLKELRLKVATAESCTGGLLGAMLSDLPGAGEVFLGGFIAHTYDAKEILLGIPRSLLESEGAVSAEVARLMAEAARAQLKAGLGLSITCIAGPGGQEGKPIGLGYVAASIEEGTMVREMRLGGGRASNRVAAVEAALQLAIDILEASEAGPARA
jgi:PncC family amidohydrolase